MTPTTEQPTPDKGAKKRIILCCDGTWFDSDDGFNKATRKNKATLQVASNVTRISRCFKRRCSDGTLQIINYESGVGTGSNTVDTLTGGAFGLGLTQVCNVCQFPFSENYVANVYSYPGASVSAKRMPFCAPTTRTATRLSLSAGRAVPLPYDPSPA